MKLLFDQNLPPRLVDTLGDLFPGSEHVRSLGWRELRMNRSGASRETVRCRARARRYASVAALRGTAPRLSLGRRAANREFVIGKRARAR